MRAGRVEFLMQVSAYNFCVFLPFLVNFDLFLFVCLSLQNTCTFMGGIFLFYFFHRRVTHFFSIVCIRLYYSNLV